MNRKIMPDNISVDIPLKEQNTPLTQNLANTVTFSWNSVGFTVDEKKGKEITKKVLISNNTGRVQSGQVVAIMGGSGAGKSTLLNCLSGRIGAGDLSGQILFNDRIRDEQLWKSQCAFVEQDDIMYHNLTVFETLKFAAFLRLPKTISRDEKLKRVEKIIMDLGLNGCRNVRIGNTENKGISGGERKRLAIGVELVTEPDLLFLDEPTSGLDAFTAFNIITTIKNIAAEQNRIVILTIHQPRTDILKLFDKILLLSMGNTVFYGTVSKAMTHFEKLGFQIPPNTNPSDFFSDITTLDQRSDTLKADSQKRIELFTKSWAGNSTESLSPDHEREKSMNPSNKTEFPSSWMGEFSVLLQRNMLDVSRDPATLGATLGQAVILFGFIFWQMPLTQAGVQNRVGFLFFIVVNGTFGNVMPTIGVFPDQRPIIRRERAAGTYRPSSAYLAKFVSSVPLLLAGALLMAVPIYWMVGLVHDAGKFFTFLCVVVVHAYTANAMGLMIGSFVPSARVGQIIAPLIIVIFFIFGGLFTNLDTITPVLRWIQWISIISYSYKALAQNEFTGLTFECPNVVGQPCYTNGEQVLNAFNLTVPSLWYCVIINAGISVVFVILGYLFFSRTSAPIMRLK